MIEAGIVDFSFKTAIKIIFEKLDAQYCLSPAQKREWYNNHIEPSYLQIKEIHLDYTKQLLKTADSLKKGVNIEEVAQTLKRERPLNLCTRQEIIANLEALKNYRQKKNKQSEFELIFYNYVESVDQYLNSAYSQPSISWYSYFIERFSEITQRGDNPLIYNYATAEPPELLIRFVIEDLEVTVQYYLPESLKEVQKHHASLKSHCL